MITIDELQIEPTLFPDKTSQVWKLPEEIFRRLVRVKWQFEDEAEFIWLAQLKDLLDMKGCDVVLELSYLPYGRQDKHVGNESTFALRTFARLVNALGFYRIECFDPHSGVPSEIIWSFTPIWPTEIFQYLIKANKYDLVCYPDAGAHQKYSRLMDAPFIYGTKIRNSSSGVIEDYALTGNPSGKSILIVDDICDGGATFIHLADQLIACGARSIDLYVSHGLFSRGTEVLKQAGISRIFTKEGEVK